MLKKVSHIILSLLIVASTIGLTYNKHFCSASSATSYQVKKSEHIQHEKEHKSNHIHNQLSQLSDDCADDACCENETCHDDNCCHNEIKSIKLSLDYVKIETKEFFKTFELKLFHTELIVFNDLINESAIIGRYSITDSPPLIKNTQSILQTFRC